MTYEVVPKTLMNLVAKMSWRDWNESQVERKKTLFFVTEAIAKHETRVPVSQLTRPLEVSSSRWDCWKVVNDSSLFCEVISLQKRVDIDA